MDEIPRRLQRYYRKGVSPPTTEGPNAVASTPFAEPGPANPQARSRPERALSSAEDQRLDEMSANLFDELEENDPIEQIENECHNLAINAIHEFFLAHKRMPSREETAGLTEKVAAELQKKHPLPKRIVAQGQVADTRESAGTRRERRRLERQTQKQTENAPDVIAGPSLQPLDATSTEDLEALLGGDSSEKKERSSDEVQSLDDETGLGEAPGEEDMMRLEDAETGEARPKKKKTS